MEPFVMFLVWMDEEAKKGKLWPLYLIIGIVLVWVLVNEDE